jgi:hypothetical protein
MSETHTCPRRGCARTVSNHLFACRNDWFALSKLTRDLIWATAHLSVLDPERRAAFRAADADWDAKTADSAP